MAPQLWERFLKVPDLPDNEVSANKELWRKLKGKTHIFSQLCCQTWSIASLRSFRSFLASDVMTFDLLNVSEPLPRKDKLHLVSTNRTGSWIFMGAEKKPIYHGN